MRRHSFGFPLNMRQYQRAYILFFSKVNKIVYPSAYVSVLHYGATRTKKSKCKCKYASRDKQYEQQRRRTNTFESSTSLFTVESSTVIVAAFVIEVKPSNK